LTQRFHRRSLRIYTREIRATHIRQIQETTRRQYGGTRYSVRGGYTRAWSARHHATGGSSEVTRPHSFQPRPPVSKSGRGF
jgi:hypothetical protein